jgi:antitoxin component of RelBE/YafQ-DinJ toxin-antitoxin module
MNVVLYVRIPEDVKADLDALAEASGLSLTRVTAIVLARGLRSQNTMPEKTLEDLLDARNMS